jgi:hypothetical protein
VRPHGQLIEIYIYTQSFQSRKPQQKIYTHMLSLANINLYPHNNLGKFIYTPMPSKKIGRNLCVCTGMEPLSVTINFRQFLIGWVRIPYTHVKFPQFVMRDTCTELNPPTQLEFKNFAIFRLVSIPLHKHKIPLNFLLGSFPLDLHNPVGKSAKILHVCT